VGGDQLTRVRLEGAKSLRKGAHTAVERFDQLNPFIIELFHTLQDFIEVLEKYVTRGLETVFVLMEFNLKSILTYIFILLIF
jgi:hypothetical protein